MPKAKTKKRAAPPIEGSVRIRMSDAYKEWLERAAEHGQTNVAGLVSIAVAHYMKSLGFEEKPPRRVS